ncbi:hypothetical protein [Streptomyces sp. NPDC055243]|uniref:hypothetical protein n=1 Tax=Streptomyces sp. NPDC055243 TaxID=3365720 RepID=UPI0037D43667
MTEPCKSTYRIDWTGPEAIAVTINIAPVVHLPDLILRIAERLHRRDADFAAPHSSRQRSTASAVTPMPNKP